MTIFFRVRRPGAAARVRAAAAALAVLSGAILAGRAPAQDGWDAWEPPFAGESSRPDQPSPPQALQEDTRPYLPPMNGPPDRPRESRGGEGWSGNLWSEDGPPGTRPDRSGWRGDGSEDPAPRGIAPEQREPGRRTVSRSGIESEDLPPLPGAGEAAPDQDDGREPHEGTSGRFAGRADFASSPAQTSGSAARRDTSGLPGDLWRGLDIAGFEALLAKLAIPPRSPALAALWRRSMTGNAAPPQGGEELHFAALRAEALYRSGLMDEAGRILENGPGGEADALREVLLARNDIGFGARDKGCARLERAAGGMSGLPKLLRREAVLALGYCAAVAGNAAAEGLSAELAREDGAPPSPGLEVLDALAAGRTPAPSLEGPVSVADYRLVELSGTPWRDSFPASAAPPVLLAVARSATGDPFLKLAAGEAAAGLNAIAPRELAGLYRAAGEAPRPEAPQGGGAQREKSAERAWLYSRIAAETAPEAKARTIRAFLDEGRTPASYPAAAQAAALAMEDLPPGAAPAWFAGTAIEAGIAAGRLDLVRSWLRDSGPGRWQLLGGIAAGSSGGERDRNLRLAEDMFAGGESAGSASSREGRFGNGPQPQESSAAALHRLVTVLDALDYNVPVSLWDAANRVPQPDGGHLPDTGVLPDLQDAVKKGELGRTLLLVIATVGPDGAGGAHIIALGDAVRALWRAGLKESAHQLAAEALLPYWPHAGGGAE